MRDDFSEPVKRALALRVGNVCSRPGCETLTSGPHEDPSKALNIGVAAHITAASNGGPRYDERLTPEERRGPENGVWLCQNCGKLVDNDPQQFPASMLRDWKEKAEDAARTSIGKTVQPREPWVIPPLSPKLQASRSAPDPETIALDLLRKHFQAYMRIVHLIKDIGDLPHNSIVNISRPQDYDEKKRAVLVKFSEDYMAFQSDFEQAITLLEAVRNSKAAGAEKDEISAIMSAAQEVATTVAEFVAWTQDKHNEPLNLGMLHERPAKVNAAREAGRTMNQLVARRMIARGQ